MTLTCETALRCLPDRGTVKSIALVLAMAPVAAGCAGPGELVASGARWTGGQIGKGVAGGLDGVISAVAIPFNAGVATAGREGGNLGATTVGAVADFVEKPLEATGRRFGAMPGNVGGATLTGAAGSAEAMGAGGKDVARAAFGSVLGVPVMVKDMVFTSAGSLPPDIVSTAIGGVDTAMLGNKTVGRCPPDTMKGKADRNAGVIVQGNLEGKSFSEYAAGIRAACNG